MPFELLQHAVVTIVAIGAAILIARRVAGVVRTPGTQPKCSSCPSAKAHSQPPREAPLTLIRNAERPVTRNSERR
jgi:hypothetical protein